MSEQGSSVQEGTSQATDWRETIAVILLSITAVLTAWSGFQSSKWGGAMSISFAQASTARLEATRAEGDANRQINVQVGLYTAWASAVSAGDQRLADYLAGQFPEPLLSSFEAWQALDPMNNPSAPGNPLEMPQYVPDGRVAAEAADDRADAKYSEALANNQRGDNYTLMTVLFALVLFFTAVSGRVAQRRNQWILLGLAGTILFGASVVALSFPKLV